MTIKVSCKKLPNLDFPYLILALKMCLPTLEIMNITDIQRFSIEQISLHILFVLCCTFIYTHS